MLNDLGQSRTITAKTAQLASDQGVAHQPRRHAHHGLSGVVPDASKTRS